MQNINWDKIGADFIPRLEAGAGTPHTEQKVYVTPYTRAPGHHTRDKSVCDVFPVEKYWWHTTYGAEDLCETTHTTGKHILKAGVGFEGFKRAGEGSEENNNTNNSIINTNNHTGEKTIEVQTHTGENTSQEVLIICNRLTSN